LFRQRGFLARGSLHHTGGGTKSILPRSPPVQITKEAIMKFVALAVLATVAAAAVPASAAPLSTGESFKVAQADINVRIGEPRRHRDTVVVREGHRAMARECKTVIIKERHHGMMVTKRIRRCR
jgi:hypothetical protein